MDLFFGLRVDGPIITGWGGGGGLISVSLRCLGG